MKAEEEETAPEGEVPTVGEEGEEAEGGEAAAEGEGGEDATRKPKPARERAKGGGRADTRGKGAKTSSPRKAGGS